MKRENRWHLMGGEESVERLQTDAVRGLSPRDAEGRLTRYGENSIWKIKRASVLGYALEVLSDLATVLLIAVAIIAAIFGGGGETAAICLIVVAGSAVRIAVYIKSRRIFETLAKNVIPKTRVIRGGKALMVPSDRIVPGDVMVLSPGDTVPCDARIISSSSLTVSEDKITENTGAVKKDAAVVGDPCPIEKRSNILFGATTVLSGSARAVAFATGRSTYVSARHGGLVIPAGEELSVITRISDRCRKTGLVFLAAVIPIAFGALMLSDGTYTSSAIFMSVLSYAVASISEYFAAIGSMAIANSMREAAPDAALKDAAKLETASEIDTVIFSPSVLKNGVLSTVGYRYSGKTVRGKGSGGLNESEELDTLLEYAYLSTGAVPGSASASYGDDSGAELRALCEREHSKKGRPLGTSMLGYIGKEDNQSGGVTTSLMKGKPNTAICSGGISRILAFCTFVRTEDGDVPLTKEARADILRAAEEFEADTAKVIAFSSKKTEFDNFSRVFSLRSEMVFEGFIAVADPVSEGIPELIGKARKAGCSFVMFTDGSQSDRVLAEKCGILTNRDTYVTSAEAKSMRSIGIASGECALVELSSGDGAEIKSNTVELLERDGRKCAVLGSELLDLPSMKKSDISMALTKRASLSRVPLALLAGSDVIIHSANGSGGFMEAFEIVKHAKNALLNIRRAMSYMLMSQSAKTVIMLSGAFFGTPLVSSVHMLTWGMLVDFVALLCIAYRAPDISILYSGKSAEAESGRDILVSVGIGAFSGIAAIASGFVPETLFPEITLGELTSALFMSTVLSSLVCAVSCGAFPKNIASSKRAIAAFVLLLLLSTALILLFCLVPQCASLIGGGAVGIKAALGALAVPLVLSVLCISVKKLR